ncbi:hypothetical protein [Streptomyces iakyrus]|uniref:hypothetical protein n=1 Tax=Streptomyces iakyrus TaxID=68219 RepID=UPI00068F0E55
MTSRLTTPIARPPAISTPETLMTPHLFADYSPDEIAVLHDWFTRASTLAANYVEEHCRPD